MQLPLYLIRHPDSLSVSINRNKGNIGGGARERRRREPLGGCGGMVPQKILKSRGLEMAFPPIFQELFVIYASQQTNAP